jgi:ubiquinone/menaquinone biosynthesis C-methylase UbiE
MASLFANLQKITSEVRAVKDVFQILNQIDGGVVLDAATGRGEFINILKQYLKSYTQIIGVDYSEKSAAYAQKLFPENNVEIYRMNLENLPYEDGHFDTVCTSNSLHHFENLDNVLAEMLRVLKPGGTFILTEMYAGGNQSQPQLTHVLMHHWVAKVDSLSGVYHDSTYSKEDLISIVKKLKLQKIHIEDFYPEVDDPKDPKATIVLIKNCQDTIKRLQALGDYPDLIQEGEALIERINEIGFASASRILITAHKPKGDK